jgi:tetratricopeptide (TPR) repeat protein
MTKLGRVARVAGQVDEETRLYAQAAPYFAEAEATLRPLGSERRAAVAAAVELGTTLARLERFDEALEVLGRVLDEVGLGGTLPDVSGPTADAVQCHPGSRVYMAYRTRADWSLG